MAARGTRMSIAFVAVVVIASASFFGIRGLWNAARDHFTSSGCTVGAYTLDTDQASVAAQMIGAVSKFSPALPTKAGVLVLMAGLQESKLRNLAQGAGDRDSVGVLQQRPSQGWGGGDAAKLNDVTEATREFLKVLVSHTGWRKQSLAQAIQDVQVSADGSLYAQHQDEATALANALQGRVAAGLTCSFDKPTVVATTAKVVTMARRQLPVDVPTVQGHTITVASASWQTAIWFVANADRLGIDTVAYLDKVWTRSGGWKTAKAHAPDVVATMASL